MKIYNQSNGMWICQRRVLAILGGLGFSLMVVLPFILVGANNLDAYQLLDDHSELAVPNIPGVQLQLSGDVNSGTPILKLVWLSDETDRTLDVAWGDYDNDGDLDLAVGNMANPNRLYRNEGGQLSNSAIWSSSEYGNTNSIGWGDYDNDGDLDLAVGNVDFPDRLYRNEGGELTTSAVWSSNEYSDTRSIAWGDYDGDGYLDLAVGNEENFYLYHNDAGQLSTSAIWAPSESNNVTSLAWGDYDNDGDIDLVVGSIVSATRLYRNDEGLLNPNAVWASSESEGVSCVVWGDYDNDGDLDLVVGGNPNRLYRNDRGQLTSNAIWTSSESENTKSLMWGDYDGDGDLDLASGNFESPNHIYRNDTGQLTNNAIWSSGESYKTYSIAWGDYDNDGDLDLLVGDSENYNRLYRNEQVQFSNNAVWSSNGFDEVRSIAWGDYDADGDLDLAVGNSHVPGEQNHLYRNDNGQLTTNPVWSSSDSDETTSIAWGDYDGDGDLDLAVGNNGFWEHNLLYRNDAGQLTTSGVWSSNESDNANSIAWGDYDSDGDLDLAVGTDSFDHVYLYRNDVGELITSTAWSSSESYQAESIAWGDYDNDSDLDLAVGNYSAPNHLYRNDAGQLTASAVWSSDESDPTTSVAWGDYDSDGDLDLVVGNLVGTIRLYRNNGGQLTSSAVWSPNESDYTQNVIWGDYDGDGDLDLIVGNAWGPNRFYRNDKGQLTDNAVWSSSETDSTYSVAWGDYDSDGDLDLAVGNWGAAKVYRNSRDSRFSSYPIPIIKILRPTPPANADGYSSAQVWQGRSIAVPYTLFQPNNVPVQQITGMYSLNGGGQWLPAVAASNAITTDLDTASYTSHNYLTTTTSSILDVNTLTSTLTLTETDPIADIDVTLNLTHTWDGDLVITLTAPFTRSVLLVNRRGGSGDNFTNTIFDDDAPTRIISGTAPFTGRYRPEQVFDRFVGYPANGKWSLSISDQAPGDVGTLLSWGITVTLNTGAVHTYTWDVYESGFMGQSDNVVFRMVAIPAIDNRPNQIPGPYLYGSYASHTFPFRVRGSQVRVLSDTVPAKDAVVYRLPVSQTLSAQPYVSLSGEPFHTDGQGYLQGRGEIRRGDRLFAMVPITWTDSYTLYYTSGDPTLSGLDFYTVTALGVQTLTVSAANPLLLFDLDVSLEWDARNDAPYLTQLERDLQRTSQVLYDLSNGQIALGNTRVFHAKERWMDAHIVIRASNKARPIANLGGVVSVPTDDVVSPSSLTGTQVITSAYIPGQVHIGATWNRFGEPGGSLEDDWSRALAHELGHYLLFLQDNYLGVSEAGLLTHTDCRGSAMTDPYLESYSEFLDEATWTGECLYTLSEHTTGRADWETITAFYPMLRGTNTNHGPSDLPLDITQVTFVDPITPTTAIPAPYFGLTDAEGRPVLADNAQAYLFKLRALADPTDDDVLPLGSPNRDLLLARGAAPGDRICVFDDAQTPPRVGCLEGVEDVATAFVLHPVTDWSPDILVTPINSRTFGITVTQVLTDNLWVQVLPDNGPASDYLPMAKVGDKFIQIVTLAEPAFGSLVRVWVPGSDPHQEAVTCFALGEGWDGYSRGWPGYSRGWPGYSRGWPGFSRGWPAPVSSNDGQVIIFDLDNVLSPGADYALQTLASPPDLPAWLTPVGQAYRYVTNQAQTHTSILFKYLQRDVPEGQEYGLRVYYSPDDGQTWHRLPTELDTYRNLASAEVSENGIYVLISTVEMPPFTVGWNNFGYPVPGTRPVTDALASIAGKYTSVYEYNSAPSSQWLLYDQTVADRHSRFTDLVNDLTHFEFGRGYWLYATEPVTLYLGVGEASKMQATQNTPLPPATFYGWIVPTDSFTPTVGMTITAWISDTLCGESAVSDWHHVGTMIQGWLPYKLQVKAADSTSSQCGASGKTMTFRVGDTVMFTTHQWDNSQAWFHNLSDQAILYDIYLPLIIRKG